MTSIVVNGEKVANSFEKKIRRTYDLGKREGFMAGQEHGIQLTKDYFNRLSWWQRLFKKF